MAPGGSVLNFSFAATLIRVRNRSKDLRRSITVDGIVRLDGASNASSEMAQLIRRMPSRISKCMKSPSRVETASDVSLNIDALMPSVARVGTHDDHLAFDWLCLSGVGDAFGFFISRLPYLPLGHPAVIVEFDPKLRPVSSGFFEQRGPVIRAEVSTLTRGTGQPTEARRPPRRSDAG